MECLAIQIVHLAPQLCAPFGDPAGDRDIGDDSHSRRSDQFPTKIEVEDHTHRDQLDCGWRDIEQQEIEHHVDALGSAFDDLGDFARPPPKVKAQA